MEFPRIMPIKLPKKMENLVEGIATKEEVTQQMVIPIFLGTIASVSQSKFEVRLKDGAKIPLGFFGLLVAESGTGKTPIFEKFTDPLDELIGKNKAKIEKENNEIDWINKILDNKIKKKMKEGIKCNWDTNELADAIKVLEEEKASKLSPAAIYTTNSNSEGLAKALNEQEGHRYSILDSEGSSVQYLCRYPLLATQLNYAYDNSAFSATRAKNGITKTEKGVASIVLGMQPEKFKTLWGREHFWYEGFIPRILPFFGEKLLLTKLNRKIINIDEAYEYYKERLTYLFHYPWKRNGSGTLEPHELTLDADSLRMYEDYKKILAPTHRDEDGRIDLWRIKAIQKILRIAALFHIYEVEGDPVATPIAPTHIELAGERLYDLIPNVEYVRGLVAPTDIEKTFEHLISWLHKRFGQRVFKVRDICRSTNMKSGPLLIALGRLLKERVLDEYEESRLSLEGRPPEGGFILNWTRLMELYPPKKD